MDSGENTKSRGKRHAIRDRSFAYALRAIRLYQYLQKEKEAAGQILGKQYLRAACSIGANIEESQSGESRADFIHKLEISQKEARENLFWLRLMAESRIVPPRQLKPLMQKTEEMISVITSIIVSTKGRILR